MPPWNKGRTVGKKRAFSPDQINKITIHLKSSKQWHDLCLLTLGIDTMLRASDLLKLRVSDVVTQNGDVLSTFPLRQTKTAHGVYPVLTTTAQEACQQWIKQSDKRGPDFLFTGKKTDTTTPITGCVYRCLVKRWAKAINLEPDYFSTHSIRRTKIVHMFGQGVKIEYLTLLLGHRTPQATMEYLGVTLQQAQQLALENDIFIKPKIKQLSPNIQISETASPEDSPMESQIQNLHTSVQTLEKNFSELLIVNQQQTALLQQLIAELSNPKPTKE